MCLLLDWSEASSIGTLRSASIPPTSPEPRLPSYLSLACTVNGYSTTTNYDPERLARSRDTSPHRPNEHNAHQDNLTTYSTHNNLLSPPNLVPLPIYNSILNAQKYTKNMSDNAIATATYRHREFYSSNSNTTTTTFISSETKNITSTIYSSDTVGTCLENGIRNTSKSVKYEANTLTAGLNSTSEKSVQEYSSAREKSVIQQRVERLYGPGFLAQGFLLVKRQKNKSFETENLEKNTKATQDKHSKSMNDQLLTDESLESGLKQSTSSPTLPVFRHLRPEFRAQLPIVKSKKAVENNMPKSVTIPTIVEGIKVNGHSNDVDREPCDNKTLTLHGNTSVNGTEVINGTQDVCDKINLNNSSEEIVTKDGHYFLSILEKETTRLLRLADQAEKELEQEDLPEEAKGYLRSASGKAKLLVSQKMQQFRGLCTNNIKQVEGEAFPTTNEDLQGFWDMIMLQVDQVDTLFKELDTLRSNNWQEQKPVVITNGSSNKPKKIVKSSRPIKPALSRKTTVQNHPKPTSALQTTEATPRNVKPDAVKARLSSRWRNPRGVSFQPQQRYFRLSGLERSRFCRLDASAVRGDNYTTA
ncbi:vlc [Trypoxylus dichotomus]